MQCLILLKIDLTVCTNQVEIVRSLSSGITSQCRTFAAILSAHRMPIINRLNTYTCKL